MLKNRIKILDKALLTCGGFNKLQLLFILGALGACTHLQDHSSYESRIDHGRSPLLNSSCVIALNNYQKFFSQRVALE